MYGGCATFTAHLLHTIGKKYVLYLIKRGYKERLEKEILVMAYTIRIFQ